VSSDEGVSRLLRLFCSKVPLIFPVLLFNFFSNINNINNNSSYEKHIGRLKECFNASYDFIIKEKKYVFSYTVNAKGSHEFKNQAKNVKRYR